MRVRVVAVGSLVLSIFAVALVTMIGVLYAVNTFAPTPFYCGGSPSDGHILTWAGAGRCVRTVAPAIANIFTVNSPSNHSLVIDGFNGTIRGVGGRGMSVLERDAVDNTIYTPVPGVVSGISLIRNATLNAWYGFSVSGLQQIAVSGTNLLFSVLVPSSAGGLSLVSDDSINQFYGVSADGDHQVSVSGGTILHEPLALERGTVGALSTENINSFVGGDMFYVTYTQGSRRFGKVHGWFYAEIAATDTRTRIELDLAGITMPSGAVRTFGPTGSACVFKNMDSGGEFAYSAVSTFFAPDSGAPWTNLGNHPSVLYSGGWSLQCTFVVEYIVDE